MLGKSRNVKVRGVATRSKKGALRRENRYALLLDSSTVGAATWLGALSLKMSM